MQHVRLTHPDLPDQPIDVPEAAVPHHARAGWVVEQAPTEGPAATGAPVGTPVASLTAQGAAPPAQTTPPAKSSSASSTSPDSSERTR